MGTPGRLAQRMTASARHPLLPSPSSAEVDNRPTLQDSSQVCVAHAITAIVGIAAPQLSESDRLHIVRSLFADMADLGMIRNGGAPCVDLVPGHWIISGYQFDGVFYIRVMWPSGLPRGIAGQCRHLLPADEVPGRDRYIPFKAQQVINTCRRDASCWVRRYPEVASHCLHKLFNQGELQALSVGEVTSVDGTPYNVRWADGQPWPTFAFTARYPKRTRPVRCTDPWLAGCSLSSLVVIEYGCNYDPLAQQVLDARLLPSNGKPLSVPPPSINYYLPRGAHR